MTPARDATWQAMERWHEPAHDCDEKSGDPESNQGPSDFCKLLQSDALPTELSPVLALLFLSKLRVAATIQPGNDVRRASNAASFLASKHYLADGMPPQR